MLRVRDIFSRDDLRKISDKISEIEKNTSGEIRVSIREKRSLMEKKLSIFDMALREFYRLGMDKTKDGTGVLVYILLSEKKLQIVADKGINDKVENETWQKIADKIAEKFKQGKYLDGIIDGLDEIGKILSQNFPIKPDDRNELSNEVEIR
ncbi:TLP18.3, Psb32 and MOLO-1 founding protein of phosphatase [Candidatus Kryptobacter tengchongensis]|uniref:TLP18.3, Psb32 and MOLO-1 founding protein of phosphatase n=1 Tax=Kryptobacter tengchongensis TaxID=1643429 RepID=A0A916LKC7_KRYT1|nr:TPM domain-containing protein [Candidatus Kryptobacter tengchongensis]CUS96084.1 TLP18.3, Psb32 and MOLO-1 founding protein of phosphatase [Candidatus Kryptobacter tengchongensis]CUT04068.1 TLP18.3, Psb32 and MOLO-1 founding protein of phosphatase [Candidatus Kryptobacter tengchongensis]CUU07868.1 TLP18.3, Psb32 and MOLO-1 founding protein of phosphatase [Candidatus Kryptobacter tengchongensis]